MSKEPKPYHHGDLRTALLAAAEVEVQENGIEAFSLRSVAKRAGVSHAAPAHHFGDAKGLLTALAADGFRQFLAAQARRQAVASDEPVAQLVASGLGYIDFAEARPALFRLIFSSRRPDYAHPELQAQAKMAYDNLHKGVTAAGGDLNDISAVWAMAHGLADLLASGRTIPVAGLPADQRDVVLARIIARAFVGKRPGMPPDLP